MSANAELVTGHSGTNHISSVDMARLNHAIFGDYFAIIDGGNGEAGASITAGNEVAIHPGDLMIDGRHVIIPNTITFPVPPLASNGARIDFVVLEYTCTNGIEDVELKYVQGTEGTTAQTPQLVYGNTYLLQRSQYPIVQLKLDHSNTPVILGGIGVGEPHNIVEFVLNLLNDSANYTSRDSILLESCRKTALLTSGKGVLEVPIVLSKPVRGATPYIANDPIEVVVVQNGNYIIGTYSSGYRYEPLSVASVNICDIISKSTLTLRLNVDWSRFSNSNNSAAVNNQLASVYFRQLAIGFR